MRKKVFGLTVLYAGVLHLAACSVDVQNHPGDHKSVDVRTPFADVSVRTDNIDATSTGLPVYPGARPTSDRKNRDSADVMVGNSLFGVRVIAAKYDSTDPPEEIVRFYRREMANYGAVTECRGRLDFDDSHTQMRCREKLFSREIQLGVGARSLQRVVVIKPTADGSELSTVYIETRK